MCESRKSGLRKIKDCGIEGEKVSNFREQLYETARQVGIKVLSDDDCCRVLAWLYVYGGGKENTVVDDHLRTDILEAQKRLNIFGSEKLNRLIFLMKKYVREITGDNEQAFFIEDGKEAYDRFRNPPEWVGQLEKKYGLPPTKRQEDVNK
jgi:hypothetical protein